MSQLRQVSAVLIALAAALCMRAWTWVIASTRATKFGALGEGSRLTILGGFAAQAALTDRSA